MTLASTFNLNSTTPAAATGRQNVAIATDAGTPVANISLTDPPMVGDTGTGGKAGNAPAPASGDAAAGKFLKADGTWAVPPGSGTSVEVNGSSALTTANLNNTTPAAGSNGKNVSFQVSGTSVSAELVGDGNAAHYLDGTGNYTTPSGGSTAFSAITGATNTSAAMVVGSGASIAPTGTGTVQATNIAGTISAGANVTITGSGTVASPYSIAASGGGGGSVTPMPPYMQIGASLYDSDMYAVTLPPSSPSFLNSVAPTVTVGTNGNLILTSASSSPFWLAMTGAASAEAVLRAVHTATGAGSGVWLWDSTNNKIWVLLVAYSGGGAPTVTVQSWNYSGSGNPSFSTTGIVVSQDYNSSYYHIKASISAGTITFSISLDGGVSYFPVGTQSAGTISKGGVAFFPSGSTGEANILSLVVA